MCRPASKVRRRIKDPERSATFIRAARAADVRKTEW